GGSQGGRRVGPGAAGKTAVGWAGYSYRTPDTLANADTRTAAASRAELIKGLTAPSAYDSAAPPVFADTPPVPAMTWKTQPLFGHLRGVALASDGTPLADTVLH